MQRQDYICTEGYGICAWKLSQAAPASGRGMVRRHPRQQQLLLQPPSDPAALLDTPGRSQTL